MDPRSIGVEEELLLVDPDTGRPLAVAGAVLTSAGAGGAGDGPSDGASDGDGRQASGEPELSHELQRQQVETNTSACRSLDELGRELRRARAAAAQAAASSGAAIAALATSPVPVEPALTSDRRYQRMAEAFGLTAQEQLTCGCHVHVAISSPDEGVAVLDRIRPWLAVLLALSANSPFWQGEDSSYASFRYQSWGRWPSSGTTEWFGSSPAYEATLAQMLATATLLDTGMVYFDARLSRRYPTVEVRIADVCLRPDDAVLIAALTRALTQTASVAWRRGLPPLRPRIELLRLAAWRASRSGMDSVLVSPVTGQPDKAAAVAGLLLEQVGDALEEAGEAAVVTELLSALLARGNGAAFQRAAYRDTGELAAVVSRAAAATAP